MPPRLLLALLSSVVLAACTQSTGAPKHDPSKAALLPPPRKLYMGTDEVRADIATMLTRLQTASPQERLVIQAKLVRFGEPAVAPLTNALAHPTPHVRSSAAYALGMIKDPRALDPLASRLADPDEATRFEVATAMLRMNDMRAVDTLMYGLEHSDPRYRARSILILQERTGQRLGYQADDAPEDRSAAVARWRAWARERQRGW